jgi:transcription elongation factor Elf1
MTNCDECGAQLEQRITTVDEPFCSVNWAKDRSPLKLVGIQVFKCPVCNNEDYQIPRLTSLAKTVEENPGCDVFAYGWHAKGEK